jgi:hypothetical protein
MTAARELDPHESSIVDSSTAGPIGDRRTTSRAEALATVTDVTGRIAVRQIVELAKHLLMTKQGMTESEAHRWIQKTSMDRRSPKHMIAAGIVSALGGADEKHSGTG